MKLDDFVAVSGMSGIFRMVANRSNGLIVEDLDNGKKKFASARKHQFTPLVSIGIYTDTDTTELKLVFQAMLDQLESNPPVSVKASASEINDYFAKILPEYDRDRVYISDIKKVIKWFTFLHERDLLNIPEDEEETKEEEKQEDENTTEAATTEVAAEEEE